MVEEDLEAKKALIIKPKPTIESIWSRLSTSARSVENPPVAAQHTMWGFGETAASHPRM